LPRSYGGFIVAFVAALLVIYILVFSMAQTITNVSAVETEGVGVYWNYDCSDRVSLIAWGTLEPGSSKNIVVYVLNQGNEPIFLVMSTREWSPSKASEYMALGWDYSLQRIDPGEVYQITLTLSISHGIEGISSFSFDILLAGSQRLPGDCNGDGYVNAIDVNSYMAFAYGSQVGDPNYDPNCDFNGDGYVNAIDVNTYLSVYYGNTA
jgi:hypothetical protein